MKITKFTSIVLISIFSCTPKSEYPGFSKTRSGIHYKLKKIGESDIKARQGDYVTFNIEYRTIKDSLFFEGKRKFQLTAPEYKGSIDECFLMLAQEDAATFILSAYDFFTKTLHSDLPAFLDTTSRIKVYLEVLEIQTEEEYKKEKEAFIKWIDDFNEYEKVILRQYIQEEKLDVQPTKSGLYYITLAKGKGKKVEKGDTVILHYEGKFLNGKFIDSTIKRGEAFSFVYGQEWQVIEGLEEAIGMMKQGEKALIILPSKIAFGKTGSSTGIVPPYTSLIYEVELVELKKAI